MKIIGTIAAGAVMALVVGASGAQAVELVVNGDFATGDFTGWTLFTTANGTLGAAPQPRVTAFDVTGSGASQAAEFEVGSALRVFTEEGGGIRQSITTTDGLLTFRADFAAATPVFNVLGGVFTVFLDGVSLDSVDIGSISAGTVRRGSLSFSTTVTAGSHLLTLQATRGILMTPGVTPYHYFDNVSATQADIVPGGVPEPATWALMLVGFGGLGAALRRRRGVEA